MSEVFAVIQHPHQWKPKLYWFYGLDEAFRAWSAESGYIEIPVHSSREALKELDNLCDLRDRKDAVVREFRQHVRAVVTHPEFSGVISIVLESGFEGNLNLPSVCDKNKFDKLQFIKEEAGGDMSHVTIHSDTVAVFSFEEGFKKNLCDFAQALYAAQAEHNKMSERDIFGELGLHIEYEEMQIVNNLPHKNNVEYLEQNICSIISNEGFSGLRAAKTLIKWAQPSVKQEINTFLLNKGIVDALKLGKYGDFLEEHVPTILKEQESYKKKDKKLDSEISR